ncbi:MAG: adenylate kinase [Acidobacteriaceae bacterium]|nr:adenylate kinase [Acidobacteriaceae bacterium]
MIGRSEVIIFLGPPGAGKGTQAARIASMLGIPAISTGEMLREECRSGSELGEAVSKIIASGKLVSDGVVNQIVSKRLERPDCEMGCILDGYPRTVEQARFLDRLLRERGLAPPTVIDFDVDCQAILARLGGRRQCVKCGKIFSFGQAAGSVQLFCDLDGNPLVTREDDSQEVVGERLRVYARSTLPLVRYYRQRKYHRIQAVKEPEAVTAEILSLLSAGRRPVRRTPANRRLTFAAGLHA